jgi:hypothetical protein
VQSRVVAGTCDEAADLDLHTLLLRGREALMGAFDRVTTK